MKKSANSETEVIENLKKAPHGEYPLLMVVVEDTGLYLPEVKKLTEGLAHLPLEFRVLVVGPSISLNRSIKNAYCVEADEVERFFTFAHMAMFISEHPSKRYLSAALASSAVPIVHSQVPYFKNYSGPGEDGNAFQFEDFSAWSMYACVVRGLENYGFPYDWKNIIKAGKKTL